MTFEAFEESGWDAQPIELYEFSRGVRRWRYTSSGQDVVWNGSTWTAATIRRGGIERTSELNRSGLDVEVARDFAIAEFYRVVPPSDAINLTIWRLHAQDPDAEGITYWMGRVVNCEWRGSEASLKCEPVTTSMKRPGLRMLWQKQCPHVLYGAGCTVDKNNFKRAAIVESISGAVVTVTVTELDETYDEAVLADTPLAYWRLGEASGTTAEDSSGNNRDGTYNGPMLGADGLLTGDANKAATFDGVNDYVEVPHAAWNKPTAAVSFECWWAPASITTQQCVMGNTEVGGYELNMVQTAGVWQIRALVRRNGDYGRAVATASSVLAVGQRAHLVGTFDGRYTRLYVNGQLVGVDDAGATYAIQYSENNSLMIGAEADDGTVPFGDYAGGVIDEVALYSTALSAGRVALHYSRGIGALEEGDGYYNGGMLEWTDGDGVFERRFIRSQVGGVVTLNVLPYGLEVGGAVNVYPGCDHTVATCTSKFNNLINYGGTPHLPAKNPFSGTPIF